MTPPLLRTTDMDGLLADLDARPARLRLVPPAPAPEGADQPPLLVLELMKRVVERLNARLTLAEAEIVALKARST